MFETRTIPEAKPLMLLRRATIVLLALFLVVGLVSSYRAYIQVQNLELRSSEDTVRVGSIIETDVVSSARTTIAVRLELIQGSHIETLDVLALRGNEFGFFDPRFKACRTEGDPHREPTRFFSIR